MKSMTASILRCSRRLSLAFALALVFLLGGFTFAHADGISVRNARLVANDEGSYALEANFDLALNSTLEEALTKGVSLYFLLEFDVIRKRWYWVDEKVVDRQQQYKLSFNSLTGQYRLGAGPLYQNFETLGEALDLLAHVRRRQVVEPGVLRKDNTYVAAVRMRLDVSQLPKPFQLSAFGSRDWNIGSDWYRWTVTP
jgi:hypothetical protein